MTPKLKFLNLVLKCSALFLIFFAFGGCSAIYTSKTDALYNEAKWIDLEDNSKIAILQPEKISKEPFNEYEIAVLYAGYKKNIFSSKKPLILKADGKNISLKFLKSEGLGDIVEIHSSRFKKDKIKIFKYKGLFSITISEMQKLNDANKVNIIKIGNINAGNVELKSADRTLIFKRLYNYIETASNYTVNEKLGARIKDLDDDLKDYFQMPKGGVVIVQVDEDKSGKIQYELEEGTVIYEINGEPVNNEKEFKKLVFKNWDADKLEFLSIDGDGNRFAHSKNGKEPYYKKNKDPFSLLGVNVRNLEPDEKKYAFETDYGVFIDKVLPGSSAERQGLAEETVILKVNDDNISNTRILESVLMESIGKTVTLSLKDADGKIFTKKLEIK